MPFKNFIDKTQPLTGNMTIKLKHFSFTHLTIFTRGWVLSFLSSDVMHVKTKIKLRLLDPLRHPPSKILQIWLQNSQCWSAATQWRQAKSDEATRVRPSHLNNEKANVSVSLVGWVLLRTLEKVKDGHFDTMRTLNWDTALFSPVCNLIVHGTVLNLKDADPFLEQNIVFISYCLKLKATGSDVKVQRGNLGALR